MIALELGPASLGNPPGFDAAPFAAVQRAALRVKLLPLLHKELKIGSLEIDGLDLRLVRNAAGKGNWQDWPADHASYAPATPNSSSGSALPDIGGVEVKDSRVSYQDMVADHLNFEPATRPRHADLPQIISHPDTVAGGATRRLQIRQRRWMPISPPKCSTHPISTLQLAGATLSGSLKGSRIVDAPTLTGTFKLDELSPHDLMEKLGHKHRRPAIPRH